MRIFFLAALLAVKPDSGTVGTIERFSIVFFPKLVFQEFSIYQNPFGLLDCLDSVHE